MTTSRGFGIFVVLACAMISVPATELTLLAQGQPQRTKIAVLRFKSSRETQERKTIVKDFATSLAAAMRENAQFEIPEDWIVKEALEEEGLKPDGLLKQEKCVDVGKALKVDYVVVGSALLQGLKWHANVRVLSVQNGTLVATVDAEYSVDEMSSLFGVLASRISAKLANPPKEYVSRKDFTWKGEYLVSFGKHRIDIEPPILLAMHPDPPFEVSLVAEMAAAMGGNAVTNFEVFVDDLGLGSVYGSLSPPVPIKAREWKIGDCTYIFALELKEMRVFTARADYAEAKFVTSARILVTARPRKERD